MTDPLEDLRCTRLAEINETPRRQFNWKPPMARSGTPRNWPVSLQSLVSLHHSQWCIASRMRAGLAGVSTLAALLLELHP